MRCGSLCNSSTKWSALGGQLVAPASAVQQACQRDDEAVAGLVAVGLVYIAEVRHVRVGHQVRASGGIGQELLALLLEGQHVPVLREGVGEVRLLEFRDAVVSHEQHDGGGGEEQDRADGTRCEQVVLRSFLRGEHHGVGQGEVRLAQLEQPLGRSLAAVEGRYLVLDEPPLGVNGGEVFHEPGGFNALVQALLLVCGQLFQKRGHALLG